MLINSFTASMRRKGAKTLKLGLAFLLAVAVLPFGLPVYAAAGDTLEAGQVGVILDDTAATKTGSFTTVSSGVADAYGSSFLYSNHDASKSLTFTPAIPENGLYEFYVRMPSASKNYNGNVPYSISSEDGTQIVNLVKCADQTTNWVKLGGAFPFRTGGSYTIVAGGSAGYAAYPQTGTSMAVDAIKLIKVGELPPPSDQALAAAEAAKYEATAFINADVAVDQSVYGTIVRPKTGQIPDGTVQVAVYAPVDGTYLAILGNDFRLKAQNFTGAAVTETAVLSFTKGSAFVTLPVTVTIAPQNAPDYSAIIKAYMDNGDAVYKDFTPGIFNTAEGTVEMTVRIDKPLSEFGNYWDFLFYLIPAQGSLDTPGNTLMAAHIPPMSRSGYTPGTSASYEQPLTFLTRNGDGKTVINATAPPSSLSYTPGEPFNLAFSWKLNAGGYLAIYKDGAQIGRYDTNMAQILERFMPFEFSVNRSAPYNVSNLKISTRALAAAELETATGSFTKGADTALLADVTYGQAVQAQKFVTPWHTSSGYSVVKPAFRSEKSAAAANETSVYPVMTVNYGTAPKTYTVTVKATATDGTAITHTAAVAVPADGTYRIEEIAIPELDQKIGFWKLQTTISSGSTDAIVYESGLSRIPVNDEGVADGPYADYYGQHISTKYSMDAWTKIGTSLTRGWEDATVFKWYDIEPTKGHFTWEKADAYVKQAQAADLEVLAVLGYPSTWASSRPADPKDIPPLYLTNVNNSYPLYPERWAPKDIVNGDGADWSNYVYQSMKRYAGKVKYWEIWNEVNFHPPGLVAAFSGTTGQYLLMQKLAYQQAQRVKAEYKQETGQDLELYVTTSGFSGTIGTNIAQKDIILETLKDENVPYYDIFTIHGYEGTDTAAMKEILNRFNAVKQSKPSLELWQGEVYPVGMTDTKLRMYDAVEKYMEFLSAGASKFINMGTPADDTFIHRYTQTPTEVFQTTAVLQNHIRKVSEYKGSYTNFAGSDYLGVNHYLKRTDNKYVSVLAAYDVQLNIHVSNPSAIISVQDAYGNAVPVTVDNGVGTIVKDNTLFIVSSEPLSIVSAETATDIPLIGDGGFERIQGDWAGWPYNVTLEKWSMGYNRGTFGTQTYVSQTKHEGTYALEFNSIAAPDNRTFMYQSVRLFQPGTYILSAWIKKLEGGADVQPELNIWDGHSDHQLAPVALTNDYACYSMTYEAAEASDLVVNVGILSGAGKIVIDDVSLVKVSEDVAITMDDSDTSGVVKTGAWTFTTDRDAANNKNFSVNTSKNGTASVKYTPTIPLAGMYEVSVFFHATAGTSDAPYTIQHAGGTAKVIQNQNMTGGKWISLGEFPFLTGTGGSVTVTNSFTQGNFILADGVRFTRKGALDDQTLVTMEAQKYENSAILSQLLQPGTDVDAQVIRLKQGQTASSVVTVQRAVYDGSYLGVNGNRLVVAAPAQNGETDKVWVEFRKGDAVLSREISVSYQKLLDPVSASAVFRVGAAGNAILQPNELLQAKLTVRNEKNEAIQVVAMVALYEANGNMLRFSYVSRELAAGAVETLGAGFLLPEAVAGCTVKALVWQGTDPLSSSMQPLTELITLP